MDYADVNRPSGQINNMGGTKQRFWFAPIDYFDTIASTPAVPTTPAELVTIADSHTFLPNKGFHKVYITLDKNGIQNEIQGERDGKSYKQTFKGFTPGSNATLDGLFGMSKNDNFICLIEETDGVVRQVGTADFYASMTGSFNSGEKSPDLRGYEIMVESVANYNYRYDGTIVEYSEAQGS